MTTTPVDRLVDHIRHVPIAPWHCEPTSQDRTGEIHVSSALHCELKLWHEYHGTEVKRTPDANREIVFAMGHAVHSWVQSHVIALGGEIEVPVRHDNVIGHADAVLENQLIEIKSVKSMYYIKREPNRLHMMQAAIYARILQLSSLAILYVNRIDGEMCWHNLSLKRKYESDLVDIEIARLAAIPTKKYLEVRPEPSWMCDYCDYRSICPTRERKIND